MALPVRTSKRKTETDSDHAPTCPQSYAYRPACTAHACPSVTIVAWPALAYRVRLRVRLRACARVPARVCVCVCACAYGGERVREVGLLPSRMLPKITFRYFPSELSGITASGWSLRIASLSELHEASLAS